MLVDLLREHPEAARTAEQRRARRAILTCRTAAQGGHVYRCDPCGRVEYAYHSCHHRACGQCGGLAGREWLEERKRELLPVPYFLVTFTVPEELRELFRREGRGMFDLLFQASARTLGDVARSKVGGEMAALGVLHTWSRQLVFHPHVHYIVPGGFLSEDGLKWIRLKDGGYLLPHALLSRRMRSVFRQGMMERPELLAEVPGAVWRKEWVVDVQAVGTGEKALGYLAAGSVTGNGVGSCGEGFWLWPRRLGRSIPKAGCDGRANAGHGQKTRRPEGFRGKGPLASLLVGQRPLAGILPPRASPSSLFRENRTPPNFRTRSHQTMNAGNAIPGRLGPFGFVSIGVHSWFLMHRYS